MKLIFIGTLHCGFTPNKELEKLILKYKPEKILIEIKQKDIDSNKINKYPPEMKFTLEYAKKNNIQINGFDSTININTKNATKKDEEEIIEKQTKIINKYDWKEFNKKDMEKLLQVEGWNKIIDQNKWKQREEEMKRNIEKYLQPNKTTLVITGVGHIPFFKKQFLKAKFPLSN